MSGGRRFRSGKGSAVKAVDPVVDNAPNDRVTGRSKTRPEGTGRLEVNPPPNFTERRDQRRARETRIEPAQGCSEPHGTWGAGPGTTLNTEVASSAAGYAPVIEEAAILYANGQAGEAKARLMHAIQFETLGANVERVWMMLLDLHQELGEEAAFDALALEFAVRFERSAPAWRGRSPVHDPLSQTSGGSVVSLTGRLSAASASQVSKLRELATRSRLLRIDFSKLKGADAEGCKLLLALLQAIRKSGGDAMFSGESVLLGALIAGTPPGDRSVDAALWLLRLELLQWQGGQSEFEDVALAYAVTYEVSPPSFESKNAGGAAANGAGAVPASAAGVVRAPREIAGQAEPFFRKIIDAAGGRASVQVDCAELKRMDFVSAGNLLNVATRLQSDGKKLELRQVNTLVAALLEVMGITEFASLTPRR